METSRSVVVLVVQPILAHYRRSLFRCLTESTSQQWKVVGGDRGFGVKSFEPVGEGVRVALRNHFLRIGGHVLVWQTGVLSSLWRERPSVVVLGGVDLHLLSNLAAAMLSRLLRIKVIWWGHGSLGRQGWLGRAIRRLFFRQAVGVFTYGDEARRMMVENGVMPANRVVALKNCINIEDYGFLGGHRRQSGSADGAIRLLFSGRLTRSKRPDLLLRAVACLRDRKIACCCDVVGDGDELDSLRELADALGIADLLCFHGALYGDGTTALFRNADLFVLPGKVGLSVVHSLSYGLPVLTIGRRDVHSPEVEIIRAGETGDFFDQYSPEALADKIAEWAPRLREERTTISECCIRSIVEEGYLPEPMAGKMRRAVESWCVRPRAVS